jgi:2-dehydropantoate 2-reductase
VQNGLGNEEVVAELVHRVVRGSVVTAGTVTATGSVWFDAPGDSWFGPFEPSAADVDEIALLARLLTEGGLPSRAVPDGRARRGRKWCSTPRPARSPRSPV